MRSILKLFYAPAIRTVPEAHAMAARRREATASQRARFVSFVEAAKVIQPGLFVPPLDDAVLAVTMPAAERDQVARLARAAAMAGLHMLDPQNDALYRADGCVAYANGSVTPMPAPPAAPPAAPGAWGKPSVHALVSAHLARQLAVYGFKPTPTGAVARVLGSVEQTIFVVLGEQAGALVAHPRFMFQCRDVWQVWHDALGKATPPDGPDVTLNAMELAGGTGPSHQGSNAWRTMREVEHWLASFDRWFEHDGLPRLNSIQRAADVAALALTEAQMHGLPKRGHLTSGERFSRMVLAAAFDAPRLSTWARVLATPRPNDGQVERSQLKKLAEFLQA
ncbi:hypothetical protein AACH06_17450 [Ideonella sp. DXS29W]|uniref:Uncharacterized protein n=1 Tax=Ideonella lacteola TaxID=2984193 RepID=A0ABU9BU06_9BURK